VAKPLDFISTDLTQNSPLDGSHLLDGDFPRLSDQPEPARIPYCIRAAGSLLPVCSDFDGISSPPPFEDARNSALLLYSERGGAGQYASGIAWTPVHDMGNGPVNNYNEN